jgi:glyoxylase-like metal-dependent hydrolase (beta-lactamase superfamily II)
MIKTFRYDDDVDEFSANTYVIGEKNQGCIVIDLGSTTDRVIKYIKENHASSVLGVLLTHGHFDHIRGLNKFLKKFPCTVFIDRNEVEMLNNTRLNGSVTFDEEITVNYNNLYLLDDEDEINFGNGYLFKVIETPGHTRGSVCFELDKEKAIFTGDTLFKNSVGRTDLPTGSIKSMNQSLERIKHLPIDLTIYPGHGDYSNLKKELETNVYLK